MGVFGMRARAASGAYRHPAGLSGKRKSMTTGGATVGFNVY